MRRLNYEFLTLIPTLIEGVFQIEYKTHFDSRGNFTKIGTPEIYEAVNGQQQICQVNYSENDKSGTWRGFHVQGDSHPESKIINCISGSAIDYLVDVRSESKTFGKTLEFNLSSEHKTGLLVAPGIAHGYQTLVDHTTFLYLHNQPWVPSETHILDYKDTGIGIKLKLEVASISELDSNGESLEYFSKQGWRP